MRKMLIASAAILLIADTSAEAGMLLYEDDTESKRVENTWVGPTAASVGARHGAAIEAAAVSPSFNPRGPLLITETLEEKVVTRG